MGMDPRLLRPRQTGFTPRSISGLALWLDAADSQTLYTTDAGPVTAVSSPLDIAGCVGWWDASDASSITQSGGLVSQWNDKSGNGNHATASGSLRPTLTGNALNGMGVMTFGGSQGLTGTLATSIGTNAYSVFAVCRISGAITNGRVFSTAALGVADFAAGSVIPCLSNGGTLSAFSGTAGTNVSAVTGFASYGIFGGVLGSNLVANAANGLSNTSTSATLSATIARFGIGIAAQGGTGLNTADIAEIVYYSTALSPTDRARVEAYLAAKWGISGVHAPATATNDPVGAWLDKSGNGRHATQATGASRPTVSATALNGRRQLGLVSQHLRGPSTTWNGSATIYWVGRTGQASSGAIVFHDGSGGDQTDSFHAGWLNTQGVGAYGNGWNAGNAPRAESPSAWRNADIVAGVTLSTTEAVARVNGATANTVAALTGTLSQAAAAQFYVGREAFGTWTNLNGSLAELLIYQPALNASQRARLERYLAAKWGITLAPQVSNADAQDWINRVYANGGTVSATTASAVNQFCVDIENAGIRDRFYRLNLFAGNSDANLAAVRTPLFRGPSLTGTQYGGTTDTNFNFGPGDYAETGASGGLLGNGSTKYLNTGVAATLFSAENSHLSAGLVTAESGTGFRALLAASDSNSRAFEMYARRSAGFGSASAAFGSGLAEAHRFGDNVVTATLAVGHIIAARPTMYRNGVASGAAATASDTLTAGSLFVFSANANGSAVNHTNARLSSYSIGLGLTASQAAAFSAAHAAFNTALSRT